MATTVDTHVIRYMSQGFGARRREMRAQEQGFRSLDRSIDRTSQAVDRNSRAFVMNRREIATGNAGLDRLNRTLDRSTLAMFKFTIAAAGLEGIARIVQPVVTATVAMGTAGVKAASDWELWTRQLEVTQGTLHDAEKMLDFFYKTAREAPFNIAQVVEAGSAWERLKTSIGISTKEILSVLADLAASAVGRGRDMNLAANAMADAIQGSTQSIRRLYNIQGDAIASNAERIKRETAGVTDEQARFMAILELMGPRLGMAAKTMQTFFGELSRLGDSFFRLKVSIGRTLTDWDVFRDAIEDVGKTLQNLAKFIDDNQTLFRFAFLAGGVAAIAVMITRILQLFLIVQGLRTGISVLQKTLAEQEAQMESSAVAVRDHAVALGQLETVVKSYTAAVSNATRAESVFGAMMAKTAAASAARTTTTPANVVEELRGAGTRPAPANIERAFEREVLKQGRAKMDELRASAIEEREARVLAREVSDASHGAAILRKEEALKSARSGVQRAQSSLKKVKTQELKRLTESHLMSDEDLMRSVGIRQLPSGYQQVVGGTKEKPLWHYMFRHEAVSRIHAGKERDIQRASAIAEGELDSSKRVIAANNRLVSAKNRLGIASLEYSKANQALEKSARNHDDLDRKLQDSLRQRADAIRKETREQIGAVPRGARDAEALARQYRGVRGIDVGRVSMEDALRRRVVASPTRSFEEGVRATKALIDNRLEAAKVNVDLAESTEEVAAAQQHVNALTKESRKAQLLLDAARNKGVLNLKTMSAETAALIRDEALESGTKRQQITAQYYYNAAVQRGLAADAEKEIATLKHIGIDKLDELQTERLIALENMRSAAAAESARQINLAAASETRLAGARRFAAGAAGKIGGIARAVGPFAGLMAGMAVYLHVADQIRNVREAYKKVNAEADEWASNMEAVAKELGVWSKQKEAIQESAKALREFNTALERQVQLAAPGVRGIIANYIGPSDVGGRRGRGVRRSLIDRLADFPDIIGGPPIAIPLLGTLHHIARYQKRQIERTEGAERAREVVLRHFYGGQNEEALKKEMRDLNTELLGSVAARGETKKVLDQYRQFLKEHPEVAKRELQRWTVQQANALKAENQVLKENIRTLGLSKTETEKAVQAQQSMIKNLDEMIALYERAGLKERADLARKQKQIVQNTVLVGQTKKRIDLLKAEIALAEARAGGGYAAGSIYAMRGVTAGDLQRRLARGFFQSGKPAEGMQALIAAIEADREDRMRPLQERRDQLFAESDLLKTLGVSAEDRVRKLREEVQVLKRLHDAESNRTKRLGIAKDIAEKQLQIATLEIEQKLKLNRNVNTEIVLLGQLAEAYKRLGRDEQYELTVREQADKQRARTISRNEAYIGYLKSVYGETNKIAQLERRLLIQKARDEIQRGGDPKAIGYQTRGAAVGLARSEMERERSRRERLVELIQARSERGSSGVGAGSVRRAQEYQLSWINRMIAAERDRSRILDLQIARERLLRDIEGDRASRMERLTNAMIGGSTALGIPMPGSTITRRSGPPPTGFSRSGPFAIQSGLIPPARDKQRAELVIKLDRGLVAEQVNRQVEDGIRDITIRVQADM